jgi:glucans biosynthesis protein
MHRRRFLSASAALAAAASFARPSIAAPADLPDEEAPFDYATLKGHARALAGRPHRARTDTVPAAVRALGWNQYQAIRFRPEHALWADGDGRFKVRFFHMGLYFRHPVRIYELHAGRVRPVRYARAMFDYHRSGLERVTLPDDLGFAGFRVLFHTNPESDVASFLGASYFRAVGQELQFGLSARGLAVDTGLARAEEFPAFVAFWLERPAPGAAALTVYALLDSPSVTGAYRFDIEPDATLRMDVDAALYPRRPIERLGIAPLTSMFQHGENDRRMARDWRPEIHDSDGLAMWTGHGEWLWRPLENPSRLRFNAYQDTGPRGFGLLQRDRDFDHYQDDSVFYERRPSLWVEPRGDWGRGSVQLVELPTEDETLDNIVAFWNPEASAQPGQELLFGYRLHWGSTLPAAPPLARAVASRSGLGGNLGEARSPLSRRFVVDFAGGALAMIAPRVDIAARIDTSHGQVENTDVRRLAAIRGVRTSFDVRRDAAHTEPINLRLQLVVDGHPVSETWLYQWSPSD